ncbi:MAG: FKBP-type peptidyl-prolyl cis-trans isomerase [Clostridia bacterium]|nr:FKBP-type peptidyl-prolyl cis-trans isomerase [Clostridia bacterium]
MKKRIICLAVLLVMVLSLASCIVSKDKYDYDMEKYINLIDYNGYKVELELDSIQAAIDSSIMDYSKEYVVSVGDKIYIDISAKEVIYTETDSGTLIDQKGNEIEALKEENYLLSVGSGAYASKVENSLLGSKIGEKTQLKVTLPDNFYVEEYQEKEVYLEITVKTKECKAGDVVLVDYKGFFLDENGNKIPNPDKKNDKDEEYKIFDSNSNAKFYLGSKMAIDGFEENIIGMKVGDTKSFKATFPDDYDNEDVKGKTVEFEVKVTSLYTPPVYNEDFIKAYYPDYKSTEEFEKALREKYILSNIYEYIVSKSDVIKYPKAELKTAKKELVDIEASFKQKYGVELDAYIEAYFSMTRDEYIKSNMKSEMVYYAIRQRENIEPTAEQLLEETDSLIEYYKNYYMENEKLDANSAKTKAQSFVNNLGSSYVYENVMFTMVDELLIKKADVTEKPRTYVSITETLAEADKPVTE